MGKYIYGQWLILVSHYCKTVKCNECIYEIIVPLIISLLVTYFYAVDGLTVKALLKLRELLPNALAVLIGFTIMCITLLATTESGNIEEIRNMKSERIIGTHRISIFKWLLVIFSYSLIVEVFLLIYIFFVAFIMGLIYNLYLFNAILALEVVLILHVLFLIVRSITSLYLILYK